MWVNFLNGYTCFQYWAHWSTYFWDTEYEVNHKYFAINSRDDDNIIRLVICGNFCKERIKKVVVCGVSLIFGKLNKKRHVKKAISFFDAKVK